MIEPTYNDVFRETIISIMLSLKIDKVEVTHKAAQKSNLYNLYSYQTEAGMMFEMVEKGGLPMDG